MYHQLGQAIFFLLWGGVPYLIWWVGGSCMFHFLGAFFHTVSVWWDLTVDGVVLIHSLAVPTAYLTYLLTPFCPPTPSPKGICRPDIADNACE